METGILVFLIVLLFVFVAALFALACWHFNSDEDHRYHRLSTDDKQKKKNKRLGKRAQTLAHPALIKKNSKSKSKTLVSPTPGTCDGVFIGRDGLTRVQIYLAPEDSHAICSPCEGVITSIRAKRGTFANDVFRSAPGERGRLIFTIRPVGLPIETVTVYAEVGRGYITDTVDFHGKEGDHVKHGTPLGEIVIGSRAQLKFDAQHFKVLVQPSQTLQCGKTVCAVLLD